jgi:NAD(P)-dependent dehydrogenase (short-subunit alcohol dehydrogenase family)
MQDFGGKVAVITGAGSGIGRALALRAGSLGMRVVASDIEQPRLDETVAAVVAASATSGGTAIGVRTDVSVAADVETLAERAFAEFGAVHLLCNNAGVFSGGLLWERTVADWEWVMGVNLYGIVHAIRSFVPRLLTQGAAGVESHIVNTASMGGLVTNAYSGPYYASKFAAVGVTECLAHDLATVKAPIGVSVLVPSLIATDIGRSERNRQERFVDRLHSEPTPDAAFVTQMLQDSTAGGLDADEVATLVFAAVEAGDFYIPTRPSFHDQIRARHDDMQARRRPASALLD